MLTTALLLPKIYYLGEASWKSDAGLWLVNESLVCRTVANQIHLDVSETRIILILASISNSRFLEALDLLCTWQFLNAIRELRQILDTSLPLLCSTILIRDNSPGSRCRRWRDTWGCWRSWGSGPLTSGWTRTRRRCCLAEYLYKIFLIWSKIYSSIEHVDNGKQQFWEEMSGRSRCQRRKM